MIVSFGFSFQEGDGVHSMVMDTKPRVLTPAQEKEGVVFTSPVEGMVNIETPAEVSLLNNDLYLYKKAKIKIISWAIDQKYSDCQEMAHGLFFFLWEEPKDPTE